MDDRDLTSRSDLSKVRKQEEAAFAELARALCDCSDKQFKRLQLPEGLVNCVLEARSIVSPAAKDRALRLVRRELRNSDAQAVRRQLDSLGRAKRDSSNQATQWRDRLIDGGESALTELVHQHPDADRKQLRILVRNLKKATDANRPKALAALTRCVNASIRTQSDPEPAEAEPESPRDD